MHFWPLTVASDHARGWQPAFRRLISTIKCNVYVVDVEATPSRSEVGVGSAGPPLPELLRQMPALLAEM
eukprot:6171925-Pleurochrysis_carterae.AAC.1